MIEIGRRDGDHADEWEITAAERWNGTLRRTQPGRPAEEANAQQREHTTHGSHSGFHFVAPRRKRRTAAITAIKSRRSNHWSCGRLFASTLHELKESVPGFKLGD